MTLNRQLNVLIEKHGLAPVLGALMNVCYSRRWPCTAVWLDEAHDVALAYDEGTDAEMHVPEDVA